MKEKALPNGPLQIGQSRHCPIKNFLTPLQASLFLRFGTGLSPGPYLRSSAWEHEKHMAYVREEEEDVS